ncbi:hypothetical protein ACSFCC_11635 [Glaesserella parasuis]|uniref:hypothetical protein n=1 Tax=Glaesserella parasuis TaxID=738 RepID=UPI003F2C523C
MSLVDLGSASGAIPVGQTQLVIPVPSSLRQSPMTAQLTSTNGSRAIEFCADGVGVNYFTPTYDVSVTAQLVVAALSPITHIRFTGGAGDTYRVQS